MKRLFSTEQEDVRIMDYDGNLILEVVDEDDLVYQERIHPKVGVLPYSLNDFNGGMQNDSLLELFKGIVKAVREEQARERKNDH